MATAVQAERPSGTSLDIRQVAGRIGAEIRGVSLADDLDDGTIAAIRAALVRHKVIFFRDQTLLDDERQEAFGMRFGALSVPSEQSAQKGLDGTRAILELDSLEGAVANSWHTDLTFLEKPPAMAILRAVTVPEHGGDTVFVNMASVYQDLPDALRELADKLSAIHTSEYNDISPNERRVRVVKPRDPKAPQAKVQFGKLFETIQPLVRVHPESGERSLLLGRYAKLIVGLRPEDAGHLLTLFHDYALLPENAVRWTWRKHDVVMWDNRSTMHRLAADFGDQRRTMRRVTILGDRCVGVDGQTSRPLRIEPAS